MPTIRKYEQADVAPVVDLSLRAWEPNFASMRAVLGETVYTKIYPDWRRQQEDDVRRTLAGESNETWVAVDESGVTGFVTTTLHVEAFGAWGEIAMIAVDPGHQAAGVGLELTRTAIGWLRDQGAELVQVETAGDPSHAAARALYEKSGFTLLPIARYFQVL